MQKSAARFPGYQQSNISYQLIAPDECRQMDILTPDFKPHSRLPAGADTTRSGLWEFVIRYSGATVADSHGVPCI
jgi:hypothetical protein